MNTLLEQIYRTRTVEDARGNRLDPFPSSIPRGLGEALYELATRTGAERTLEVGLSNGLSCLALCQAHRDRGGGTHIAIDPHQTSTYRSVGLLNAERAGLAGYLRFYEAPSHEVLPRLADAGETIDLAFIDGRHLFDYVLVDFFYLDRILRPGGYLVFDDLVMPAVRKVVSFALRNRRYERVRTDTNRGLPWWRRVLRVIDHLRRPPWDWWDLALRLGGQRAAVLRKPDRTDDRPWDFHRDF